MVSFVEERSSYSCDTPIGYQSSLDPAIDAINPKTLNMHSLLYKYVFKMEQDEATVCLISFVFLQRMMYTILLIIKTRSTES